MGAVVTVGLSAPVNAPISTGRDALGRFGQGNGGRPPGSRNKASRAALEAVTELFGEAVAVLKVRLSEHDLRAASIVLGVVLPKDRPIEFGQDVSPATVEAALADGAITPSEAQVVAAALEKLQQVRDLGDLAARVSELEVALAATR